MKSQRLETRKQKSAMTHKKPHFLLTNDDGIHSKGLLALYEAVKDFARVTIVAPNECKSGMGGAFTYSKPLTILPVEWKDSTPAYSVSGTPVDCVKTALSILIKDDRPNMVLSGINHGTNSGSTILSSGTVGSAIEAALQGIPGIAFSRWDYESDEFEYLQKYIYPIIEYLIHPPMPAGTIYNVNFPDFHEKDFKGFKVVKHGISRWEEEPDKHDHPEGHMLYQLTGTWKTYEEDSDSDVYFLSRGYITASPLHVANLTDHNVLSSHKEEFEKHFHGRFNFKPSEDLS